MGGTGTEEHRARLRLERIVADGGPAPGPAGTEPFAPAEREALLDALARGPAAPWPGDLEARPCGSAPGAWHLEALEAQLRTAASGAAGSDGPDALAVRTARVRYHARWLLHLLAPDDPGAAPRVSVVIPYRDPGDLLQRAVRSALDQTWPRIEVVVADDGAREEAAKVLAALAQERAGPERPLRVVRQERRGVASARNLTLRLATGDLVHPLDADDELAPDAVAAKMQALACVPDAELVCSRYRPEGHSGWRGAGDHVAPDFGDAFCPSRDLLRCCVRRYPFHISFVLAPRWVWLDAGPFAEDVARGSDKLYWMALALRGTKVAALRRPLGTRRFHPRSFTASERGTDLHRPAVVLRSLAWMLASPRHWPLVGSLAVRMRSTSRWPGLDSDARPVVERARRELLGCVAALGVGGLRDGHSPRLPLRVLQEQLVERTADRPGEGRLRGPLARSLTGALRRAPPPTPADLRLWLAEPEIASKACRPALDELLRSLERWIVRDGLAGGRGARTVDRDPVERAARAWPSHPSAVRLRRWAAGEIGVPGLALRRLTDSLPRRLRRRVRRALRALRQARDGRGARPR